MPGPSTVNGTRLPLSCSSVQAATRSLTPLTWSHVPQKRTPAPRDPTAGFDRNRSETPCGMRSMRSGDSQRRARAKSRSTAFSTMKRSESLAAAATCDKRDAGYQIRLVHGLLVRPVSGVVEHPLVIEVLETMGAADERGLTKAPGALLDPEPQALGAGRVDDVVGCASKRRVRSRDPRARARPVAGLAGYAASRLSHR